MSARDDRTMRLLGADGFRKLHRTTVAIVGCGGLGTHVAQQLAYLGLKAMILVDDEVVVESNLNRYVGVFPSDVGRPKVDVVAELVRRVRGTMAVRAIQAPLRTREAFDAVKTAHWVIGCVDNDGARLVLTHIAAAYALPYIDVATDVDSDGAGVRFGGRVVVAVGDGCPYCLGEVDARQASLELASPEIRADREDIYGVDRSQLGQGGPAVVSANGVVASLAVTEFMMLVTGLPTRGRRVLNYRAELGKVTLGQDDRPECLYCDGLRGLRSDASAEDYLR